MIWRGTEWICHGTHALDQSPNERPTPLTDNEAGYYDGSGCWKYNPEGECVTSDFARNLERSLAERTEERDAALAKLVECREALARLEQVGILCQRAEDARYSDARVFARQTLEETK